MGTVGIIPNDLPAHQVGTVWDNEMTSLSESFLDHQALFDLPGVENSVNTPNKKHRRWHSQTASTKVEACSLAELRETRKKTHSFDGCMRTLSFPTFQVADDGDLTDEEASDAPIYELDPTLEKLLEEKFDSGRGLTCNEKMKGPSQSSRRRHHRRTASIIFKSEQSLKLEEEMASNGVTFMEFDYTQDQAFLDGTALTKDVKNIGLFDVLPELDGARPSTPPLQTILETE